MPVHSVPVRPSDPQHVTCKYGRCSFASNRAELIFHETEVHLRTRFFCGDCTRNLSSFESLRTHANSQHYRSRVFKCETCSSTYLDPARLAKCRKRHRGQYRCPVRGCAYANARMNSVLRHIAAQHKHERVADPVFDDSLGTPGPPKPRRCAGRGVANHPSFDKGPTDEILFKRSEAIRKEKMAIAKKEHIQWMGSEAALLAEVPKYPAWQLRDHPYGRLTPSDGLLTSSVQVEPTHTTASPTGTVSRTPSWSSSFASSNSSLSLESAPVTPPSGSVPVPNAFFNTPISWLAQHGIQSFMHQGYIPPPAQDFTQFFSPSPATTVSDDPAFSPCIDHHYTGASFGNPGDTTDPLQQILAAAASFSSEDNLGFVRSPVPYEGHPDLWGRVA